MVGLAVGAAAGRLPHRPRRDLVVQGADLRARRRHRPGRRPAAAARAAGPSPGRVALAAIWAAGWAVTTAVGVEVDQQFTVFGSSGALVVTALTAVLPSSLVNRANGSARHDPPRRLRHRPGRPPRRRAARRPRPRRRRRQPQRPRRHPRCRSVVGGDATDPAFTTARRRRRRRRLLLPQRHRTTTAGPRSSRPCSAACSPAPQAAGARLVVLDNLYAYGPTGGQRPRRDPAGATRPRPRPRPAPP